MDVKFRINKTPRTLTEPVWVIVNIIIVVITILHFPLCRSSATNF